MGCFHTGVGLLSGETPQLIELISLDIKLIMKLPYSVVLLAIPHVIKQSLKTLMDNPVTDGSDGLKAT